MDDEIPKIENDRRKPGKRCERGFDSGRGSQSGERLRGWWPELLVCSLSGEHAAGLRELLERWRCPPVRQRQGGEFIFAEGGHESTAGREPLRGVDLPAPERYDVNQGEIQPVIGSLCFCG